MKRFLISMQQRFSADLSGCLALAAPFGERPCGRKSFRLQSGFTLIELLVVVAVIGILAAIALPQFNAYRVRAFNARAQSDLKNAITAQEGVYAGGDPFRVCSDAGCEAALPGYRHSAGVEIDCEPRGASGDAFQCSSGHLKGNIVFHYLSEPSVFWEVRR